MKSRLKAENEISKRDMIIKEKDTEIRTTQRTIQEF